MNESIIIGLVQNIAILLAFSMLYDYFWSRNEKLNKIMNELLTEFGHKAEERGIQLRFDDSVNDRDILITSDSYRIKQVFNNLIGNAFKFTSEGFIEIGYKFRTPDLA